MQYINDRIDYLDSVRGLAAFAVVIYHFISSHWGWHTSMKIACMFFNGSDSVALFFVLSGLVLSLKYLQQSDKPIVFNLPKYAASRFFRLYPAFLLMLAVYYLHEHWDKLGFTFLKDTFIHNKYYLWEEALLMRDYHNLFLPAWTLGIEMAMSLLLPFLVLLIRHDSKLFNYFICIVLIIGKIYISLFLFHFCLGLLIANNFNAIRDYDFKAYRFYKYRYLLYLVVFFVFGLRHWVAIYPFGSTYTYFANNILYLDLFHYTGVAAAAILVIVINNKTAQWVLNTRPLLFLGKISYSLYLTHWLVIDYFIGNWEYHFQLFPSEKQMFAVGLIFTVLATLILSTALYYLVEKPCTALGKKVCNRYF